MPSGGYQLPLRVLVGARRPSPMLVPLFGGDGRAFRRHPGRRGAAADGRRLWRLQLFGPARGRRRLRRSSTSTARHVRRPARRLPPAAGPADREGVCRALRPRSTGINPDDPETAIRGRGLGGKVALETWWNISDQAWTSLDVSWGSLYDSYAARARLGWRFMPGPLGRDSRRAPPATSRATSPASAPSCATNGRAASSPLRRARPTTSCWTDVGIAALRGERALRHRHLADALLIDRRPVATPRRPCPAILCYAGGHTKNSRPSQAWKMP